MIAAQHATPEVVRFLLARGARAGVWSQQGEMALHRAICTKQRSEMLEKMRILIDAGESLQAIAPRSALSEPILKTLQKMEMPIGELLDQANPLAGFFKGLLGSLAPDPQGLPANAPVAPPRNPYLEQFQRTAADRLLELRKDPQALAELEAYASRQGTEHKSPDQEPEP
jgi:hypothetical protein